MKTLTKERLEDLYYSKPNKAVCNDLGITNVTLIRYLDKLGIPRKGMGNRTNGEKRSKYKLSK